MADADTDYCIWRGVFNKNNSSNSISNYSTGFLTVALGLWMSSAIVLSKLQSVGSYRNLANYTLATALRRSVPSLIHALPFFHVVYRWQNYDFMACEFFAFWETFLAVFEIESLTLVCVERYVQAKYTSRGWKINSTYYYLYGSIAVFFAFLYAYPPVIGFGRYDKDFDCVHCTYDMVLPKDWTRYLIAAVFFMRSIKPAMVMILTLFWARKLEMNRVRSKKQKNLTKGVVALVFITILFSIPITIVRGTVIITQLLYDVIIVNFSIYFVLGAMFMHWFAPTVGMIALACYDSRLRDYMVRFFTRYELDMLEEPPVVTHTTQPYKRD